jgi:purine-binding chemotaxis protein CheW
MANELIGTGAKPGAAAAPQQLLTFQLGGEPFAIDIQSIREIIEYGALTEVPLMPEFIRGVLNLRGTVVPVIDLAARFGRGRTATEHRACIVIIEVPGSDAEEQLQVLGIVVDTVSEVIDVTPDAVQPAPAFGAGIRADFIRGMVQLANRFVIILDVGRVLSIEEMALLAALEEGNPEATGAE